MDWRQAFGDLRVATSLAQIVGPANEQNLDRLQEVLLAAGESSTSVTKPKL